jgi:hypothetical protein
MDEGVEIFRYYTEVGLFFFVEMVLMALLLRMIVPSRQRRADYVTL